VPNGGLVVMDNGLVCASSNRANGLPYSSWNAVPELKVLA
jgi:hypothetical protein